MNLFHAFTPQRDDRRTLLAPLPFQIIQRGSCCCGTGRGVDRFEIFG